jgi:hypothetical protein
MERNEKGQFVKGVEKSNEWYEAMAKRTGENHKMWKPELHKEQIIECACGCGEFFNKYNSRGRERKHIAGHTLGIASKRRAGIPLSRETKRRLSEALRGKKRKKEGEYLRTESYNERRRFQREVQKRVFERDDYTCVICGERGIYLHVDHIQSWAKYPELRFEMDNCRTVCMDCHYYITFRRKLPKGVRWGCTFAKTQKQNT